MPSFRIYNSEIFDYSVQLEQGSRSAFPVTIRKTLNMAAMDVKQNTMIEESGRAFIKRKPTFFPATSTVNFAKGFEIGDMRSEVGFVAPETAKESGHATKDLEEQEYGGDIDKRAFIATNKGRTGRGNVRDKFRMEEIKKLIYDSKKERAKNQGESFIKAAIHTGYPGFVIGTRGNGGPRLLRHIISIKRNKDGNTIVKSEPIYTVKKKRKAHVKPTHFMEHAAVKSADKMNDFFIAEANNQFEKMKVKRGNVPLSIK